MPESKRFLLRLDPRLFDALRRWAEDDLRSINAQIEYILTDQARRAGRLPHKTNKKRPPSTSTSPDVDDSGDSQAPSASTAAPDENVSHR